MKSHCLTRYRSWNPIYRLTIKRFGGFFLSDHPIWGEVRRLLEEHKWVETLQYGCVCDLRVFFLLVWEHHWVDWGYGIVPLWEIKLMFVVVIVRPMSGVCGSPWFWFVRFGWEWLQSVSLIVDFGWRCPWMWAWG